MCAVKCWPIHIARNVHFWHNQEEIIGETSSPGLPAHVHSGTLWNRSTGFKEHIVGQNGPDFFQKAHSSHGYTAEREDLLQFTGANPKANALTNHTVLVTDDLSTKSDLDAETKISRKQPLEIVEEALQDIIVLRKKGASKKYRPVFKEMLAVFFQLRRGNALVFASGARSHGCVGDGY